MTDLLPFLLIQKIKISLGAESGSVAPKGLPEKGPMVHEAVGATLCDRP